ncbi:hypothetical protein HT102_11450 [Hoyosella sp. G463]|uniref:Serine/arginine repetitive matrix protein 2 n=1 Tax=Lolliginicoccus lacisalsi TaxID=2742202 RepID=A0A927JD92_9ACTN|nr:hypothetical protein [Lolliginicoccus lacisalsi]MBD8507104.1 hypothetical protein [Lolliginicoccus lacisalsi]
MSQRSTHPRSPSSRWYLLVAVLVVVGLAVGALLAWAAAGAFPSVTAEARANQPLEVSIEDEGLTIFADTDRASLDCEVSDTRGATVPMRGLSTTETISVGARTWHVVLRSSEPVRPGEYSVLCTSEDSSVIYGVGPRATVFGFVGLVLGAVAALGIGVVGGFLLWLVIFLLRRRVPPGHRAPGQGAPGQGAPGQGAPGQGAPGQGEPPGYPPSA